MDSKKTATTKAKKVSTLRGSAQLAVRHTLVCCCCCFLTVLTLVKNLESVVTQRWYTKPRVAFHIPMYCTLSGNEFKVRIGVRVGDRVRVGVRI